MYLLPQIKHTDFQIQKKNKSSILLKKITSFLRNKQMTWTNCEENRPTQVVWTFIEMVWIVTKTIEEVVSAKNMTDFRFLQRF